MVAMSPSTLRLVERTRHDCSAPALPSQKQPPDEVFARSLQPLGGGAAEVECSPSRGVLALVENNIGGGCGVSPCWFAGRLQTGCNPPPVTVFN